MGTVYRKMTTRSMPAEAEIFVRKGERFARWKDSKGKTRTALFSSGKDGRDRITTISPYFIAKYRDGSGLIVEQSTGCRDETAARRVLADLERRAELVKANVITAAEDLAAGHQPKPLAVHFDAYSEHLQAVGVTEKHGKETRRYLVQLAANCSFSRLADLTREAFEHGLLSELPKECRHAFGMPSGRVWLRSVIGASRAIGCRVTHLRPCQRRTSRPTLAGRGERWTKPSW